MENVKNKIKEYLDNKISLEDFNAFMMEEIPFSPDGVIEDIRCDADMTVKGELTESDIEDELLSEEMLKENLKKYLKEL